MMERGISLIKPSALVNVAAVAVIVASVAAVGAIFGIIPAVHSERAESLPVQQRAEAGAGDADVPPAADGEAGERVMKGRTVHAAVNGCANCGVIEAVTAIRVQGPGTGVGAVAGGVTGAAVGSQLGRGNGRTALGLLGAVGGAYAGHAIERNVRSDTSYRVTVRMDDGTKRTVYPSTAPAFAVGEKVRVVNGTIAAQG